MPSAFHGINMASNALRSFQRALDVTGNNIANVNTPGYSRQTIDFSEQDPTLFFQGGAYSLGNGVQIASVNRVRDMFLESRKQTVSSESGRLGALNTAASGVQSMFQEPGGSGIADAMDKFFNAWSGLASNSNDPAAKLQVQMAGQTLADRVRGTYNQLQSQVQQQATVASDTITKIQNLSNDIAELNANIRDKVAQGAEPNDLLDMRDQSIQQLSGLINVQTQTFADGTVTVHSGSLTLVNQDSAGTVPTQFDATTQTLTDGTTSYKITGGSLAGIFQGTNDIKATMGQLDSLADNLRTEVNTIHKNGINSSGGTGIPFFNETASLPRGGASTFDLSAQVQADPEAIASSATGLAGDGTLALQLSQLKNAGVTGLSNKTFSSFFGGVVSTVGQKAAYYETSLTTQDAIGKQVDAQIQSVSGVSTDDEMANLLKFQRSYQAVAKALSIFDSVTQDLINMLNR